VNTKVLGTICRSANWWLATATNEDSRQVIKNQKILNSHVQKFLKAHKLITKLCLPLVTDEPRHNDWRQAIKNQTILNSHVQKFPKAHKLIPKLCLRLVTEEPRGNAWDESFLLRNNLMAVARKQDYLKLMTSMLSKIKPMTVSSSGIPSMVGMT
jgi:hypothetical protein